MNFTRLGKNWDFAVRNNTILLAAVVLLSISLTVTSILAFFNRERVVLVPPRLDDKMTVAWNNAGAEYFKAFGLFVATLLGNITPANSKFVADQLSTFIEPKLYAPIRTQVLAYADDPRFARAASFNYFSPSKVVWEASTSKVFVLGTITMSSFNPQISGPYEYRSVCYEFKFMMNDGRPLIVDFNSYPGNDARTLAWIEKNQRVLDKEAKEREKKGALIAPASTTPSEQGADNASVDPTKDQPKSDTAPVDADKSVPPTTPTSSTAPAAGSVPTPPPAAPATPAATPAAPAAPAAFPAPTPAASSAPSSAPAGGNFQPPATAAPAAPVPGPLPMAPTKTTATPPTGGR